MMQTMAIFAAILVSGSLVFLPLLFSGKQLTAARQTARQRRLAEARMQARLLRMNL